MTNFECRVWTQKACLSEGPLSLVAEAIILKVKTLYLAVMISKKIVYEGFKACISYIITAEVERFWIFQVQ